jgi:hypothetical protein
MNGRPHYSQHGCLSPERERLHPEKKDDDFFVNRFKNGKIWVYSEHKLLALSGFAPGAQPFFAENTPWMPQKAANCRIS